MLTRLKLNLEDLIEEILNKLPTHVWTDGKTTFLDPSMGGGQFVAAIERRLKQNGCTTTNIHNRVFGYENNQLRVNYAVNKNKLLGTYSVSEVKNIKMKFDVVVGNPPYKQNLHLDFLKLSHELLAENGVGVIIHPASWLLNYENNKIAWAKSYANTNVLEFEFRTSKSIFGASVVMESDIIITLFSHDTRGGPIEVIDKIDGIAYQVNDIKEIKRSKIPQNIALINKIHNICQRSGTLKEYMRTTYKDNKGLYHVVTSNLVGNINKKTNLPETDFYTFISKSRANVVPSPDYYGQTRAPRYFPFNTEIEALHFLKYIKTYFARFCLSIAKHSRNLTGVSISHTPWMDFSQEWDDEKLFAHFGLTDDEVKFIYDLIPQYYDDVPKP